MKIESVELSRDVMQDNGRETTRKLFGFHRFGDVHPDVYVRGSAVRTNYIVPLNIS
jgi:hypothetical protein